jgi:hypothetical protein
VPFDTFRPRTLIKTALTARTPRLAQVRGPAAKSPTGIEPPAGRTSERRYGPIYAGQLVELLVHGLPVHDLAIGLHAVLGVHEGAVGLAQATVHVVPGAVVGLDAVVAPVAAQVV